MTSLYYVTKPMQCLQCLQYDLQRLCLLHKAYKAMYNAIWYTLSSFKTSKYIQPKSSVSPTANMLFNFWCINFWCIIFLKYTLCTRSFNPTRHFSKEYEMRHFVKNYGLFQSSWWDIFCFKYVRCFIMCNRYLAWCVVLIIWKWHFVTIHEVH